MTTETRRKYLTSNDLETLARFSAAMTNARDSGNLMVDVNTEELLEILKQKPDRVSMVGAFEEMNHELEQFKPYGLKLLYSADSHGKPTDIKLRIGRVHTVKNLLGMRPQKHKRS